jgi:hypothetical protein
MCGKSLKVALLQYSAAFCDFFIRCIATQNGDVTMFAPVMPQFSARI